MMKTQRKDVKNPLYSRRLLMMILLMMMQKGYYLDTDQKCKFCETTAVTKSYAYGSKLICSPQ